MKSIILVYILFFTLNLVAQKNNYWSTNFNTEASLLAGAVVGGNSDLTSIYYNPAGISEIKDMKFSLNTNLFNYSIVNYKNALGDDVGIKDSYFVVKPRFVSYLYRTKRDTNLSWQFALYNKSVNSVTLYNTVSYSGNILHDNILENYKGNFDLNTNAYDYRAGVGSSYILNNRISIGVSIIGIYKGLQYLKSIDVSIYPENTLPTDTNYYFANWNYYEKIYMYDVRMLAKFGIRYKINKFQFGLTTTLPSFKLWGNSNSKRRISQNNASNDTISNPDYIITESAANLFSQIKDPFSVSIGVMYTSESKKTKLYFSTEYFNGIDEYKMIDGTRSNINKEINGSDFLSHAYSAKPIVNFGVGYQHVFSETIEGLLGFKTDFDATKEIEKITNEDNFENLNQNNIDLYHFTTGAKVNAKKGSVIFGIEYVIGYSKNLTQYANFKDVNIKDDTKIIALQGEFKNNMSILYNSFGLYLGFSFGF